MEYYYVHKGEKKGPFSLTKIYKKDIKEDTLIWYEGLNDWTKAIEISELKVMFKVDSPAIPPPPVPDSQLTKKQKFDRIAEKVLPKKKNQAKELTNSNRKQNNVPEVKMIIGHLVLSYLYVLILDNNGGAGGMNGLPTAWPFYLNTFAYSIFLNIIFYTALIVRIFKKLNLNTWIIVLVIQWLFLIFLVWTSNHI